MAGRLRDDRLRAFDLERSPERRLWTAVLVQALIEALPAAPIRQGKTGAPEGGLNLLRLDRARAWIRITNPDFCSICELAGRDPAQVYGHYTKHMIPRDQLLKMKINKPKEHY